MSTIALRDKNSTHAWKVTVHYLRRVYCYNKKKLDEFVGKHDKYAHTILHASRNVLKLEPDDEYLWVSHLRYEYLQGQNVAYSEVYRADW